jgi:Spy/CpxP family protein refolding chaperone
MKTKLSLLLGALFLSALLIVPAFAQDDDQTAPEPQQAFCQGMGPGHGMGHGKGMGPGGGFGPQMAEQLELTDAQKDQMDDMRAAHQKQMIRQRADLKIARLELRELIRGDADRATINSKIDQIGKLETDLEKARVSHRLDMRDILTPEQREKLEDLRPMMGRGLRGDCDGSGPRAPRGSRGGGFGRGNR